MSEVDEDSKVGGEVEMADTNVTVPSDRTETDDIIEDNYSEIQAEPEELSPLDSAEQQTANSRTSLPPQVNVIRSRDVMVMVTHGKSSWKSSMQI